MAEYIEREAFLADLEKRYCRPCEAEGKDHNHCVCRACWVDDMMGEIGDAAFHDVAPVVRGRWVWTENGLADHEQYWFCDNCDEHSYIKTSYCPNCGARMDGE